MRHRGDRSIALTAPRDPDRRGRGDAAELFKHWVHSFEESTEEADTYRPSGFAFPPAFGRRGLEIRADGSFVLHAIGPADGTIEIPGHWTAESSDQIRVCLQDRAPFTLTILSVDDDVLRIKRGSDL